LNRKGKEQTARKIATEIGRIMKGNKVELVVPPCELEGSRGEALVGEVEVISVSDTEDIKTNQPGITIAFPNKPSSATLDLNLGNPEEQLSKGVGNVNVTSESNKCYGESTVVGTNIIHEPKGQMETTGDEGNPEKSIVDCADVGSTSGKPSKSSEELNKGQMETTVDEVSSIPNLNHNNLKESIVDCADVGSALGKPSKSNEELNKTACNPESGIKSTKNLITNEVVSNLDCNHSITEGILAMGADTDKDILALHKEPRNTRISGRKKQIPLTRNGDFLWE
jgi:hypothetical protein